MALNYQEIGNHFADSKLGLIIPDKRVSFDGNASSFNTSYWCGNGFFDGIKFVHIAHNNVGVNCELSRMYEEKKMSELVNSFMMNEDIEYGTNENGKVIAKGVDTKSISNVATNKVDDKGNKITATRSLGPSELEVAKGILKMLGPKAAKVTKKFDDIPDVKIKGNDAIITFDDGGQTKINLDDIPEA